MTTISQFKQNFTAEMLQANGIEYDVKIKPKSTLTDDIIKDYQVKLQDEIYRTTGQTVRIAIHKVNALGDLPPHINCPDDIIQHVAEKLNISFMRIKSNSRNGDVQDAARVATMLILEHFPMTLKKCGEVVRFKAIDHSTVINRTETHADLITTDKKYIAKFNLCKF